MKFIVELDDQHFDFRDGREVVVELNRKNVEETLRTEYGPDVKVTIG